MKKEKKITKLKNRYTGDIVFAEDINTVIRSDNGIQFIRVSDTRNPDRYYLVNKQSFDIIDDK